MCSPLELSIAIASCQPLIVTSTESIMQAIIKIITQAMDFISSEILILMIELHNSTLFAYQ